MCVVGNSIHTSTRKQSYLLKTANFEYKGVNEKQQSLMDFCGITYLFISISNMKILSVAVAAFAVSTLVQVKGFTTTTTTIPSRSYPVFRQEKALGTLYSSLQGVPPAFSVIDDDDDYAEPTPQKKKPPAFTIDGEDFEDEEIRNAQVPKKKQMSSPPVKKRAVAASDQQGDDYSSGVEDVPTSRPRRPRRTKKVQKVRVTNWMEKNDDFTTQNRIEIKPSVEAPSTAQNTKQDPSAKPSFPRRPSTPAEGSGKSFRQDFRGTRVFVQGIPNGVAWQDLKDHFRVAGDVVFASISVDVETGRSKGHGIVQFETTQMAQNAIEIMRDHPLNGQPLFVREDYQDENKNAQLRPSSKNPNQRSSSSPPQTWKCANENNAAYMDEGEEAAIQSLIKARDDARKRKKFDISDRIREELKEEYGVFVDDRLKMWWTAVDGSRQVPKTVQDIKGDGRWGKQTPWRQIPTTPENDACVDPNLVEGLLKQRDIARREKDFGTADALLEEARTSPDGDLELRIHDESRTWRIWTSAPPPRPVEYQQRTSDDPTEARKDAAKQCIAIVREFAPEKNDEILMLLQKFPGREFQMLKRLKKQYL